MKNNNKRLLIVGLGVFHIFLIIVSIPFIASVCNPVKADNALTAVGSLSFQDESTPFSFNLPANVESVTITMQGEEGTDFDLFDITHSEMSFSYYSEERDTNYEEFTIDYPYEGTWYFDVYYPYGGSDIGGDFSVSVDYISSSYYEDPPNTVLSEVGQFDYDNFKEFSFSTPQNVKNVIVSVLGDSDVELGGLCGKYFCDMTYYPEDGKYMEVNSSMGVMYQDWIFDLYSASGGGYKVLVYYELEEGSSSTDIYTVTDTLDSDFNGHSFYYDGNAKRLIVSLITQDADVNDLMLEAGNWDYMLVASDNNLSTFYKSVVLEDPEEGTYDIQVYTDYYLSDPVDYEIKVFTEDFEEYSEAVSPTVTNGAVGKFDDATEAELAIGVEEDTDVVLLFASYKAYGGAGNRLSSIDTDEEEESFAQLMPYSSRGYPKCFPILENIPEPYSMVTEVWYYSHNLGVERTLELGFNFSGNKSNIRDLTLTAVALSNANQGFRFTDYGCASSGDANTSNFSVDTNAKSKDLVIGAVYTDSNVVLTPTYGEYIQSWNGSGYAFNAAFDYSSTLEWYSNEDVKNYTAVAVAVRADGPALSPNSYTYVPEGGGPSEDIDPPEFEFILAPGTIESNSIEFEGYIIDDVAVDYAEYQINDGDPEMLEIEGDHDYKYFWLYIEELELGSNIVSFTAYDESGKSTTESFTFNYVGYIDDYERPFCNLVSQESVVYSNQVTYSNIECQDDSGIAELQLIVTRDNLYDVLYNDMLPETVAQDGSLGDTHEVITFTIPIDLPDGIIFVRLNPIDIAGNGATYVGSDFFTLEAEDNTPPTLFLEPVRPDPIMDSTPSITGSCADNSLYDTNSVITSLRYSLDGGSWENITPLDGGFGNSVEKYSFDLPEISNGAHTIEVECDDDAGHTSTESDEFNIISPVNVDPELITETEDFEDHTNHVLSESNLIWGNGKLRLRETITTTRTSIDTTNYPTKYVNTAYNMYLIKSDPGNANRIWYSRTGEIVSYNISTDQVTPLNPTSWGLANLGAPIRSIEAVQLNGKTYLWVADGGKIQIYNLTDNTAIQINTGGTGAILPDSQRGRLGAYILINGNLRYLNLNGTLTDTSDDTFTNVTSAPLGSGVELYLDAPRNHLYISRYGFGMDRLNDNNTPLDFSDDVLTQYSNAQFENNGNVFSMLVDPNGYLLVGMAGFNQTGGLYVVLDPHTTPNNASDDTVLKLADSTQIKNLNVYDIVYVEGQNGVGDQLFLGGELGDAYYLNFNDTYTDLLDDTYIRLKITTNNRGVDTNYAYRGSANLIVKDYNTLYVNGDVDGFQKYDLNRGWEDDGQAVVYSTPEDRLFANFFELKEIKRISNIIVAEQIEPSNTIFNKLQDLLFPTVHAQAGSNAVYYSVSVDDGITWHPITLAEILNVNQNDYKVKFKIEMNQVNNSTPVLDSYTLAFGAYQDEEQAKNNYSLSINVLPNEVNPLENFALTIKVVDELGFTNTDYNGTLSISLIDSATSTNRTSWMNINSVNLVNGEATLNNASISNLGSFVITSTYEEETYFSNIISVVESIPDPVPAITFTANRYTINLGESVTLTWNASNLTSLNINRGVGTLNTFSGSTIVAPTTTTVYTIFGNGPYGSLEKSLTIIVNQPTGSSQDNNEESDTEDEDIDSDKDGLTDKEEATLGTDPNDSDSDNDGLLDGEEVKGCLFIKNTTECSDTTFPITDPNNANTDDDGLLDGEEVYGCYFRIGTIVCSTQKFDPTDPTDPNSPSKLPVSEMDDELDELLGTDRDAGNNTLEAQLLNIVNSVTDAISTTAKSGQLPAALVATTTAATVLTAASYPNSVLYAFVWFRKRKKQLSWGLVFDGLTNKPIPFVTVRLLELSGKFVTEEISDLNGKYSIVTTPGEYFVIAKVNGYKEFQLRVKLEGDTFNLEIPMTALDSKENKFYEVKRWFKENLFKINSLIFFIGLIFSIITLVIAPNLVNLVILFIFIIQVVVYYFIRRNKTGSVYDRQSGTKLSGIFVRVFERESGRQLGAAITNANGQYNWQCTISDSCPLYFLKNWG